MGVTPASIEEMQKSKPKLRIDKLLHDCAVPMPKVFGEYNAGKINVCLDAVYQFIIYIHLLLHLFPCLSPSQYLVF